MEVVLHVDSSPTESLPMDLWSLRRRRLQHRCLLQSLLVVVLGDVVVDHR